MVEDKQKDRNRNSLTAGLNKRDEVFINFLWLIPLFLIISDAYAYYITGQAVFRPTSIFQIAIFLLSVLSGIIQYYMKKQQYCTAAFYSFTKVLDILLLVILLNIMKFGYLSYFVILIPIARTCISRGCRFSLPYLGIGFITHIITRYFIVEFGIATYPDFPAQNNWLYYFLITVVYFTFAFFLRILGIYHNQFAQSEKDNQDLVDQLGRRYAQLDETKRDKQEQYDKLKEVNLQLEDTNKKLTASIAEFFTLQQISSAISSIFDMDELLQFVNDAIIGVMGVGTSNIALYNVGGDRLKVQVSNIFNKKERAILTDNINTPYLKDAVDNGHSIINNHVNAEEYDFTRGRNVKSLMCVPLQIKGKTHGLVLIEHSIEEAFDQDNVRLLEIITQQISIAIENARLYEQLQELANTDGLTQVYNRVFFQNRLQEELKHAQQQGYEVSIILYDIDNFKRFNDSYGHLFGDIVLKTLAQLVKESVRKDDIVARFGGEEFIILLPHTGKALAFEKAEELRKKIGELTIRDEDVEASVTVSMGVSTFPTLAQAELALVNSADEALYEAKNSGKNCVRVARGLDSQPG